MPRAADELEFLSRAALALGELGPDDDLYRFVAEQLAPLAPDSLVVAISYDPATTRIAVRAAVGPEDMLELGRKIGREPLGQVFRVDDEARALLSEGKLIRIAGGMHQLTFRQWPVELARRFEAELGVRAVYGQPFSPKGDFLGAVAFLSRTPTLEHAPVIEVFARLVAIAIHRQRAEARLRDSEHRFRMLAENSQDVLFRLRLAPSLAFEYVSPAVLRLSGYTPEDLYADPRLGAACLYPAAWGTGSLRELPGEPVVARCRRKDGMLLWTEQNFTPARDASGRVIAVDGIARDITNRKEAEDALLEADRRKTEFLAVLSHELRNPLGAISTSVYLLGQRDADEERAQRARAVIQRQIGYLTKLIDDLLDVTRITRGKIQLERERVELNALVSATVEDHRAAFASAEVELEVHLAPADVFIHADRTRIHQVVANLLQNAAKFTPPGGHASIAVSADEPRGQAVVRVRNTGPGVPPELLPRLFEPFVQGDGTFDRSKGGLGLGLALVRGLVELHGGTASIQSDERRGTEVTIRVPLDAGQLGAAPPEPRARVPGAQPRRVLLIEDNADAASTLRDALELQANTVAVASTGPEGLGMVRSFGPDVVLCDIGLPGMDGYEVARSVRADPDLEDVALVALSGYATPEDVARSRDAGFDRHVSKPPSMEVLERVMSELAPGSAGVSGAAGARRRRLHEPISPDAERGRVR